MNQLSTKEDPTDEKNPMFDCEPITVSQLNLIFSCGHLILFTFMYLAKF